MLWIKIWTESQGRLPTYLLVGRSSLNVVYACSFFFFFLKKKKMSTRHAYQWSRQNEDFNCILNFGHASHRFDGFEVLDVLPRGSMDLNLDVLPRGPMV